MTKKEFISLLRNRLTGGGATAAQKSNFHPVVIDKSIELGYNDVMMAIVNNSAKESDYDMPDQDSLISTFYRDVAFDSVRERYYIVFSLFDKKCYGQITMPAGGRTIFALIDTVSEQMWDELGTADIDYSVGVMIESSRIYFDKYFPTRNFPNPVLLKAIPSFGQIADNEQINIPLTAVYEAAMRYWTGEKPNDDLNDNKEI